MKRSFPLLVAASLACSWGLQANSTFSPCVPGSVAAYEQLSGGACTVGILVFSNFNFSNAGNATVLDSASDITLTPTAGGFVFTQTSNLPIAPPIQTPLGTAIYNIGWHFFIDPGPVASGANLDMDPPFGDATVTQYFCNDSSLSQDTANSTPFCFQNTFVGVSDVGFSPTPQSLTVHNPSPLHASVVFNPPATLFGDELTHIVLNGPAGFDSVTGTLNVVGAVPEPATALLSLGSLVCMALVRRRKT